VLSRHGFAFPFEEASASPVIATWVTLLRMSAQPRTDGSIHSTRLQWMHPTRANKDPKSVPART
jgi:hypothetical protein